MALLAHPAFGHPVLARIRSALQSRVVLGVGYGIASALTGLAILLAASPPEKGPLGPASQLILTVLGLNLVLILGLNRNTLRKKIQDLGVEMSRGRR